MRVLNEHVGALPPLVHAVDPARPGARGGLLRLGRVDLGRASSARSSTTPGSSPRPRRFAAAAQGADRTMFSVHGSSGSNWIVLRTLALERSDSLVLVARNIHHSVINAIKAFGLDFRFIPTPYEPRFEAVLPPSVDDVLDALTRYPEALAVLYTSPTYEGLAANTRAIVRAVHAASRPRDGHRRRGVGRAPALPPRPAPRARWARAPTSACSRPTSSPAACSRPGSSTGRPRAWTPS